MDMISADLPPFLRLLVALGVVLLLMGGLTLILKKLGLSAQTSVKSTDKRRLKIVESLPLDARRRLVIIQCDKAEHLVILSATSETLIAENIPSVDYLSNSDQGA